MEAEQVCPWLEEPVNKKDCVLPFKRHLSYEKKFEPAYVIPTQNRYWGLPRDETTELEVMMETQSAYLMEDKKITKKHRTKVKRTTAVHPKNGGKKTRVLFF